MKLKDKKIEIIDTTLIELWQNHRENMKKNLDKVNELIKLIYLAGADFIQITEELYEFMLKLPDDVEFTLNYYYKNVEINSASEINKLIKTFENNKKIKRVRITGLDDLIFYDYESILLEINTKYEEIVELSLGDKYRSSTGMAVEWIKLGGKRILTSFAGIGGNTHLEELLGVLRYVEDIKIRGDFSVFPKLSKIYEEIIEESICYNKPIVGEDIFNVESAIHVDGIEKNPKLFEPYNPIEVGRERNIIIGKYSGIKSIKIKLKELKISYNSELLKDVLEEVRKESMMNRRRLSDNELIQIYKKVSDFSEKRCSYC